MFGEGIQQTDILLSRKDEDLVVRLKETDDQIILKRFFSTNSENYGYPVKKLCHFPMAPLWIWAATFH